MKRTTLLVALVLATGVAAAPIPHAQQLKAGTWTGTVTPPDDAMLDVLYTVTNEDGGTQIALQVPEMGMELAFENVQVEDGALTFNVSVDTTYLDCEMTRQDDGSFEGYCVDPDGEAGFLTMVPPEG